MKTIVLVLVSIIVLVLIACNEKKITEPKNDAAINNLIIIAGEYPDPPSPQPDLFEPGVEHEINWSHGERWICRPIRVGLAAHPLEFPLLDPLAGVVWPGAAIQGKSLIDGAVPDPITAPRGGGSIILTSFTGNELSSVNLERISQASVTAAANQLVAARHLTEFPANLFFGARTVRSRDELAINAEASASFLGLFSASARFSYDATDTRTWFLVILRQRYYTITFERPQSAHEFFAPEVTADALASWIGEGNPPVYVHSVSYGRIFYFLVSTTESRSVLESAVNASFFGVAGGGGEVRDVNQLRDKRIEAHAYGGSTTGALSAIGAGWRASSQFFDELIKEVDIRFAVPVSYVVRSIHQDKLVSNALSTEYTINDCRPGTASLNLNPATLNFSVAVGSQQSKSFEIINSGDVTLSLNIETSGRAGSDWFVSAGGVFYCFKVSPTGSITIAPGASKTVLVAFWPRGSGIAPICACLLRQLEGTVIIKKDGAVVGDVLLTGCGR